MRSTYKFNIKFHEISENNGSRCPCRRNHMDMSELILGGLLNVKHILYFTICFCLTLNVNKQSKRFKFKSLYIYIS